MEIKYFKGKTLREWGNNISPFYKVYEIDKISQLNDNQEYPCEVEIIDNGTYLSFQINKIDLKHSYTETYY